MSEFRHIPPALLRRYAESIPVPKDVKDHVCTKFQFWCANSGEEWAVARVKDLKQAVLQTAATGERINPKWFATTSAGNLKAPWGSLVTIAMTSSDGLKAAMYLLNICTSVSRASSDKDLLLEVRDAIMPEPAEGTDRWLTQNRKVVVEACKALNLYGTLAVKPPVPLALVGPGKSSHAARVSSDYCQIRAHPLWERYEEELEDTVGFRAAGLRTEKYPGMPLVGKVHLTHEPGLKTRFFASPNMVLQRALETLKFGLMDVLRELPWDCTHDHRKADRAIQGKLQDGGVVFSIDMSKATDNFPWSFQKSVLRLIIRDGCKLTRRLTQLFIDIVDSGIWGLEDGDDSLFVWWTKGQPLGLGPSFPLFALSHGLLLFLLNGNKFSGEWYVLGDDVCILDGALATSYRAVLKLFEVEVSESKTLESRTLAQFGGVTITPDSIFWQPKWRKVDSRNVLDVAAWWYPGAVKSSNLGLINRVLALSPPWGIGRRLDGMDGSEDEDEYLFEVFARNKAEADSKAQPCAVVPRAGNVLTAETLVKLQTFGGVELTVLSTQHTETLLPSYLMDRTEVAGFPKLRECGGREDPYTMGTLRFWRRTLAHAQQLRDGDRE